MAEGVSAGPLLTEMDPKDISQGDPNQVDAAETTDIVAEKDRTGS